MKGLKQKTIRGGLAKVVAQGTNFALRLGSLMIMARLRDPKDFGLVGMVTAIIGIFNVFWGFRALGRSRTKESPILNRIASI